jgi:hypothetical protein
MSIPVWQNAATLWLRFAISRNHQSKTLMRIILGVDAENEDPENTSDNKSRYCNHEIIFETVQHSDYIRLLIRGPKTSYRSVRALSFMTCELPHTYNVSAQYPGMACAVFCVFVRCQASSERVQVCDFLISFLNSSAPMLRGARVRSGSSPGRLFVFRTFY